MPVIKLHVNGRDVEMDVDARQSLLDVLRGKLGLTGVKEGCGVGECGACNVLIDGVPTDACLTLAVWADGKCVRTIEGEAPAAGELSPVQKAYVEAGAVQCGFCTPGLIMTTTAFLEKNKERLPDITREEIKKAHAGHLCRCTGYEMITQAVELALGREVKGAAECRPLVSEKR
ncbi:(2Fe-2S)-binding protein [Deltaproteobacteria bacterium OttesenSCG-928-K17]|nr:(2Fe-2S)-binding protein [Deltaproteobacteria bacterium OttesenSCG-928-K17]